MVCDIGYNPWDLLHAIRMAADSYKNRTVWKRIMNNGMKQVLPGKAPRSIMWPI